MFACSRKTKFLLAVLLVVVSCGRKEIVPEQPQARLRSIETNLTTVILPGKGSAELPFSVKDAGFSFTDLRLMTTAGEASASVALDRFEKGTAQGQYVAIVRDNGKADIFEEKLCLVIVQRNPDSGTESFVKSAPFTVRSEKRFPGPTLETGLPVLYVDTENSAPVNSKEEYVPAGLTIRGTDAYPGLSTGLACSIRGRGNTTWTWPKKPYQLKLEEKTSLLGMPKHKRWVLLANFMDRTLMRNLVSMHVASLTSLAWTPRCVPVELVLNGKHQGSYLLIEQVRIDKNRVNISEEEGFLLELDFHFDNDFQWIDPHGSCWQRWDGIPFSVKQPDAEDLSPERKQSIKQYVSQVSTVLYGGNFKDPVNGYAKYLDVDSFIDYWIVFEVMCNHELGNPGSVFFHKDKDGLLTAGPVWDFDWGVLSFYTSGGDRGLVNGHSIWYARLMEDPAFKTRLKARFQELLPKLREIPDYMDACEKLLTESARLNFALWNPADDRSQNGGNIINGDENLSFHDAVTRLKNNYNTHLQVIQRSL